MVNVLEKGDLFLVSGNIGHGVNCAGAMGKGIALEFRKRYPDMYGEYRELCLSHKLNPGDVYTYRDELGGRYIFNLATQKHWKLKATSDNLKSSICNLIQLMRSLGEKEVTFPKICAGLGGMIWEEVIQMFQDLIPEDITVNLIEKAS